MLVKYIVILYLITPESNYSLSIREDIEFAQKYLKYHGISDERLCTKDNIKQLCSSEQKELCSARLLDKKMEFKQFDNPCYMDLDNFCESQDNIWAIKNAGPCVMNAELRRYAKEIEKMAASDPQTETNDDNKATDETIDTDDVTDTTTDATETVTENDETVTENDEPVTENDETTTENEETTDRVATKHETIDENEATESTTDETEVTDTSDTTILEDVTETNANLRTGEEIGKIMYDDGSEKALRQGTPRFPPMLGEKTYDKLPCTSRVKPCPVIYYPICLYYMKENPNNITYYHFINGCEAQQWSCYHPERKIDGKSSMRAGYCSHIQYINYARFSHTMSAWSHYGWLHGSWPLSRILKPHQRA